METDLDLHWTVSRNASWNVEVLTTRFVPTDKRSQTNFLGMASVLGGSAFEIPSLGCCQ